MESAAREHEERAKARQHRLFQHARIAEDFAEVWNSHSTRRADVKGTLASPMESVTLDRDGYAVAASLRFRGGRGEILRAEPSRPVYESSARHSPPR